MKFGSKSRRLGWVLTIPLLLSVLENYSTQERRPFTLSVHVENLVGQAILILTVRDGNQWTEYKHEASNGTFVINGSIDEPSFAYLVLKYQDEIDKAPKTGNISELFIDPGTIHIDAKDSLRNGQIFGGANQKDLQSLEFELRQGSVRQANCRIEVIKNFVKNHPDSFVSLYALQNLSAPGTFMIEPGTAKPLYQELSNNIRHTANGKMLEAEIRIAENTSIGSMAPEFTQQDTLHQLISLHAFKGNYVLIDFWASWCKPCRVENPALVAVYKKFKGKNFKIVGVSLDKSRKAWTIAIKKDSLSWINVSDLKFWRNEVAVQYGVKTVPQNFLIDPQGRIMARNGPPEMISRELDKLLGNP